MKTKANSGEGPIHRATPGPTPTGWPEVPAQQRPKMLPMRNMDSSLVLHLRTLGWDPQDVRLMPNVTDGDRAEALKAWLEGIRLGTIDMDPKAAKWLELEARVYGLHAGKGVTGTKSGVAIDAEGDNYLDTVLQFGTDTPWTTTADQKSELTKKKRGPKPQKFSEEPQ